jgi:hypothetical protein
MLLTRGKESQSSGGGSEKNVPRAKRMCAKEPMPDLLARAFSAKETFAQTRPSRQVF